MELLLTGAEQGLLLSVARNALSARLTGRELALPAEAPAGLWQRLATFVSLHAEGRLRGCIGELEARFPLIESVQRNALHAGFDDPRFEPLRAEELAGLVIEISILTPAERVASREGIEIGRHGVILECQGRRAVFLPQVAPEYGWDVETTLGHLAVKAGLEREAWRGDARLSVFEAMVFSE